MSGLGEKEKANISKVVEGAKYLAEKDPQALLIVKCNIDILKARCDIEAAEAAG